MPTRTTPAAPGSSAHASSGDSELALAARARGSLAGARGRLGDSIATASAAAGVTRARIMMAPAPSCSPRPQLAAAAPRSIVRPWPALQLRTLLLGLLLASAAPRLAIAQPPSSPAASRDTGDPFAMCGFGESGAPVFAGEGDSPFGVGSDQWCCGNTTWSSFSWRAKATRNVEFTTLSALSAPINPGGLSNSTQCQFQRPTPPDCFAFCFNTTHNKVCKNYTAADEWSSWREFTPSAQALGRETNHSYAMSTVAAHFCGSYPNEFMDPIKHLVLKLEIYGIWFGNFSNITLEVRPGGTYAGNMPMYQLHTQVAHLSSGFGRNMGAADAWPKLPTGDSEALTVPFMVARENLTAAENDGRPVRPMVTEREHASALWAVLPAVPKPPKKIIIVQGYHGENDVQGWRDAAKALVSFGTTGMGGTASAPLRMILDEAGVTATRYQGSINYIKGMNTSCPPSRESDHCWGDTDADVAANLQLWAARMLNTRGSRILII